jgi:endonuclease/exonuclease/phosphatase family metal-dependent hydrolase
VWQEGCTIVVVRVRIATYNVHKCRGLDGRVRPSRIARVLRDIGADVVALQEVLSVPGRDREHDQPRFLAHELGLEMQLGAVRSLRGGEYGNVVLSAFPLGAGCRYDLSVAGREARGCLRADVRLEDGSLLHVFNVHLGTSLLERRQQVLSLLEAVRSAGREVTGPRVVLGDFNDWTAGLASHLRAAHFRAVDLRAHLRRRRTYPGLLPFLHLDHIYYDEGLELRGLVLPRTASALVASDHLPLVADFEVRTPPQS